MRGFAMYTSTNPDRPYAGKALTRAIEQRDVKPRCRLSVLLDACGFAFASYDFGDELWRHRDTGETLRLKYINRDAWMVRQEPVEPGEGATVVEAYSAGEGDAAYVVRKWSDGAYSVTSIDGLCGCTRAVFDQAKAEGEPVDAWATTTTTTTRKNASSSNPLRACTCAAKAPSKEPRT